MRPDRPMMSALCSTAASRIFSHGHITPVSTTWGAGGGHTRGRHAYSQEVGSKCLWGGQQHTMHAAAESVAPAVLQPSAGSHLEVVAAHHHAHNVLADVVHIALQGRLAWSGTKA